jgi:2-C-methyl-D-erythritol 4-phosphate cytidylyltransferase
VKETYERSSLAAAQTPQVFNTELILQCMEKALTDGFVGTDDASLVERYSDIRIKAVEGSYENIKITTPEDLK